MRRAKSGESAERKRRRVRKRWLDDCPRWQWRYDEHRTGGANKPGRTACPMTFWSPIPPTLSAAASLWMLLTVDCFLSLLLLLSFYSVFSLRFSSYFSSLSDSFLSCSPSFLSQYLHSTSTEPCQSHSDMQTKTSRYAEQKQKRNGKAEGG